MDYKIMTFTSECLACMWYLSPIEDIYTFSHISHVNFSLSSSFTPQIFWCVRYPRAVVNFALHPSFWQNNDFPYFISLWSLVVWKKKIWIVFLTQAKLLIKIIFLICLITSCMLCQYIFSACLVHRSMYKQCTCSCLATGLTHSWNEVNLNVGNTNEIEM